MKFLAILKDSYKEAVSGWVLQALMILAGLFMLFVVTLSYRHVPPDEIMTRKVNFLNVLYSNNAQAGNPRYSIENFVQTNSGPYWRGNYKFDFVIKCPDAESLKKAKEVGLPTEQAEVTRLCKEFMQFKELQVVTTPTNVPGELRYTFTSTDTTVEDEQSWTSEPKVFFFVETWSVLWMSPRTMVYRVEKTMVCDFGAWAGMLVSIIVTAGFIPNLLRKGALDLYIAKPIGRVQLLLLKYFGGLLFVLLLSAFTIGGIWVVVGFRSGVWSPNFLLMIPIMTFYFAILYAISTFFAVLTRSMLVSILATVLIWFVVFGVGFTHETVEAINEESKKELINIKKKQGQDGASESEIKATQPVSSTVEDILFGARRAMPRTYDVDKLSGRMIAKGVLSDSEFKAKKFDTELGVSWPEVLILSCLQIAVLLGLSCWRMVTRDG